jgi:hypothetical protein
VLAAVGVIAGLNLASGARDRREARAAGDRVDVTLVPAGGTAHDGTFDLSLLFDNHAGDLRIASVQMEPPHAYEVTGTTASRAPAGTTEQVSVSIVPQCPARQVEGTRLVVSVLPASDRLQEVTVEQDSRLLADLSRQACGFLSASEAAQPHVVAVTSQSRYGVDFRLRVQNRSGRPFTLHDIVGVALAFGVEGGLPTVVPAHGDLVLMVGVSLPKCGALPPAGQPSVPIYGSFSLELSDANGNAESLPYLTDNGDPLHPALIALKERICPPGSYRSRPPG